MKPSERRALEAEKRRRSEEAESSQTYSADEPSAKRSERHENEKPQKRKEGFFQSHIRLITFIITSILVITVLSPIGMDLLVALKKNKSVTNKKNMDVNTVCSIYDNADAITWKSFEGFNYTDYSFDTKKGTYCVREYPIKDSVLTLKVGGLASSKQLDYILLIDYRPGGKELDLFKDDPRGLINSTEQEKIK